MCYVKYLWYPHKKKKKKKNYGINEKRIKLSYAFVWVFNVEIGMNMTAILGDIVMRKESIVSHVKYFILCLPSARWIGKVYYNDFDLQLIFDRDRSFKNIYVKLFMKVTCFGLFLHLQKEKKTLFWITVLDYYWWLLKPLP